MKVVGLYRLSLAVCRISFKLVIGEYYLLPSYTADRLTFVMSGNNKFAVYYNGINRNHFIS